MKRRAISFFNLGSRLTLAVFSAALLLSFLPATSLAQDDCCFDGFYTTLSLGGSIRNGSGTLDSTINSSLSGGTLTTNSSSHTFNIRKSFPFVALSLGQGFLFSENVYGGWEAYASYASYKTRNILKDDGVFGDGLDNFNSLYSNTIETRFKHPEFGVDLRPGIVFCTNTLLYGRLGVAYNKFKIQTNPTHGYLEIANPDAFVNASILLSNSKKRFAWRLGLGLERRFCNCLSLRADYAFTYFGSVRVSGSRTITQVGGGDPNISNINESAQVKLLGNAITLGLSYWW